jgi:hypothetical protein
MKTLILTVMLALSAATGIVPSLALAGGGQVIVDADR